MKNALFFIVIICVAVACSKPPKAKVYACQEYSLDCELQKDRILILPIAYDAKTIDACGYKMVELMKNNQWYIVSTKNQGFVPVTIFICLQYSKDVGCSKSTNTPTVDQILSYVLWKEDKKIKIDTTDLSHIIPGLTKAAVVVCGPNEIVYGDWANPFLARPE